MRSAIALTGWRTPALVIAAGCLIGFIPFGLRSGPGLFLTPMSQELGWGREVFAFSLALQNIIWGVGVPLAGIIADKFGAGRVLAAGGALLAAGFALTAAVTSPWEVHLAAGVLTGLGMAGSSFTIVLAVLARIARPERRALALGLGTAATSFGQFVLVPVAQLFIELWGWRSAFIGMGALAAVVIPLAPMLRGRPGVSGIGADQGLGAALGEAFAHRSYQLLVAGFFVCGFQLLFINAHLPAYLADRGLPPWVAGAALALIGLTNVVGGLAAGYAGTRYPKRYGLAAIYLVRALAIAVFVVLPPSPGATLAFGAVMGFLWLSTVPLTSGLVAQFFGLRWMASLFGLVFLSHQVGAFLGTWLGGFLFDRSGSYDAIWWISVALGVLAALIHLPIREVPVPRLAGAAA